ncbi:hypothetical protein F5B18DRAFT_67000 [Nemania serpens]|nr:hypothetical protein F5B18DRAFT_67000 [Nemania serpens]
MSCHVAMHIHSSRLAFVGLPWDLDTLYSFLITSHIYLTARNIHCGGLHCRREMIPALQVVRFCRTYQPADHYNTHLLTHFILLHSIHFVTMHSISIRGDRRGQTDRRRMGAELTIHLYTVMSDLGYCRLLIILILLFFPQPSPPFL